MSSRSAVTWRFIVSCNPVYNKLVYSPSSCWYWLYKTRPLSCVWLQQRSMTQYWLMGFSSPSLRTTEVQSYTSGDIISWATFLKKKHPSGVSWRLFLVQRELVVSVSLFVLELWLNTSCKSDETMTQTQSQVFKYWYSCSRGSSEKDSLVLFVKRRHQVSPGVTSITSIICITRSHQVSPGVSRSH